MYCDGCGIVSLDPIPGEDSLRSYYNGAYTVSPEAYARGTEQNAPRILRGLGERFPGRGKLLEVGCS